MCANLPLDKSYEQIRFEEPSLWSALHKLFTNFFADMRVPTPLILPLFKNKGLTAYLKDNYYVPNIMQNLWNYFIEKDKKFASERDFFSHLQFGFKEGVGCIEASFTIVETINHIIEREERSLHAIWM